MRANGGSAAELFFPKQYRPTVYGKVHTCRWMCLYELRVRITPLTHAGVPVLPLRVLWAMPNNGEVASALASQATFPLNRILSASNLVGAVGGEILELSGSNPDLGKGSVENPYLGHCGVGVVCQSINGKCKRSKPQRFAREDWLLGY